MRVNKQIKEVLSAISRESVTLHNDPKKQTRYMRRMIRVYNTHLSDEERIYLLTALLDMLHYRNIAVDPDVILAINNVRLRSLFFVFMGTVVLMIVGAGLFRYNTSIGSIISVFTNFIKMFSL